MWAFFFHPVDPDRLRRKRPLDNFFVFRNRRQDTFGRSGVRAVIDVLRSFETVTDLLKSGRQVGTADTVCESRRIAEEQCFKLMQLQVREEP